ncbi:MAG: hypothetical protein FJW40_02185 [Acidobacteria bacterium]|nr:hypothetical protein [Acidobacteriota bacterium]
METDSGLLIVALHGYGQSGGEILDLVRKLTADLYPIAALNGPNQHYRKLGEPGPPAYNWGVAAHWREAVDLHHRMVLHVAEEAGLATGIAPNRRILLGFSQPVGLNYRLAATHPGAFRGVAGICGGVPRDWETSECYGAVEAALLHIARDADEFYPAETANQFPARLRHRATDVEYHLLPGPHRFPSQAGPILDAWLRRIALPDPTAVP